MYYMRKLFIAAIAFGTIGTAHAQEFDHAKLKVLGDRTKQFFEIKEDMTLKNTEAYLLTGIVYVKNGATLTIEKGTVIFGDTLTNQRGVLVITREGKINAIGTETEPIVFTSPRKQGEKRSQDWGGLVIFGKAPINQPAGTRYEGGIIENPNDAEDAKFGGTDKEHSSGILQYVRIEFAGFPMQIDREVNGLTLGGVGRGTTLDHIQVSYSGDDSYEWFGGTVNAKYLLAYRGLDDDFDCDFGYSGNVQFGVAIRDANLADKSQSNGFEVDNDGTGTNAAPFTSAVFSNMTMIGPMENANSKVNAFFGRAAHLRRNCKINIYNSLFMGWPTGVYIDGQSTADNAAAGELNFKYNLVQAYGAKATAYADIASNISGFDMEAYFNSGKNIHIARTQDAALADPFNPEKPNAAPLAGSPLVSGANFSDSRLKDPFFAATAYRGAVDPADNWLGKAWLNFDPVNTNYKPYSGTLVSGYKASALHVEAYPNPFATVLNVRFLLPKSQELHICLTDAMGRQAVRLSAGRYAEGEHAIQIPCAELEDGLYLLQINGQSVHKLLKNSNK